MWLSHAKLVSSGAKEMTYIVVYDEAGNIVSCNSGMALAAEGMHTIVSDVFVSPDTSIVALGPPAAIVDRPPPIPTLDDLRRQKISAINERAQMLLRSGTPVADGLHVALDDGSRSDLTAMAATASAAASGAVPWPESYSRGWITVENVRIPLATPADGLTLAASVGDWYAAIVQHRRDLKDQVLAAADVDALDALDITAGWPA